jgi:hypothetical protein
MILGLFGGAAREQRAPVWGGIAVPLASLLFIVIVWNATLYALVHRGIECAARTTTWTSCARTGCREQGTGNRE